MDDKVSTETNLFDDFDLLETFLLKGDDLQKISVVENLPRLFEINAQACMTKIIPKLQQELINASCEIHIVTSRVFRQLLEKTGVLNVLVQPILIGIDNKDPIIAGTWLDTLLVVTKLLPIDTIKNQVLPLIVNKTQINKALIFRIGSCKMLGQIAAHPNMTTFDIKRDILPYMQSLCQDFQFEVRATMCSQMPFVAKGLQNENLIKSMLLPNLVELCSDENTVVRISAIDVISLICPFLNNQALTNTIIPLFKQVCVSAADDFSTTFACVARNFGKILQHIQHLLGSADCVWMLQMYRSLSKRGFKKSGEVDPTWNLKTRESCAVNLPIMAKFVQSRLAASIEVLYSITQDLASDPCYLVRKAVAANIIELMGILDENVKQIKSQIIRLIKDEADEVLEDLVPNIGRILQIFLKTGIVNRETMTTSTVEVGKALLKSQLNVFNGYRWRLQIDYLNQLEFLPAVFPSDFIHQQFTPGMFVIVTDSRFRPVRIQAIRTILVFLRFNIKEPQRKWIRENLYNKLCCSKSCYTRILYIKMCDHAFDVFSNRYFKEFFLHHLMSLTEDPVSNIRLSVVNSASLLKNVILTPPDKMILGNIEHSFIRMQSTEDNKEIVKMIKCALRELKNPSTVKPNVLLEERRRIDEEEKINIGKLVTIDYSLLGHGPPPTKEMATSKSQGPIDMGRDVSFLMQYFYIDAGVQFPSGNKPSCAEAVASVESTTFTEGLTNLTDDDKANMIERRSPGVKRRSLTKRYSSINLYESSRKSESELLKRRSLNVPSDLSRIPVSCNMLRASKSKENLDCSDKKVPTSVGGKSSQLPVLKKRIFAERRY